MRRPRTFLLLLALLALLAGGAVAPAPAISAAPPQIAQLVDIRAAHHPGYDRLVFEFLGPLPTRTIVEWVPVVIADGSGFPVPVSGRKLFQVTMQGARGHDENTSRRTYPARQMGLALPNLNHVVNSGDFEATLSFGVGVMRKVDLHVFTLTSPSRVVIDVPTPFVSRTVKAWYLDVDRFVAGVTPFRVAVSRAVPEHPKARIMIADSLHRLFAGPTLRERARSLRFVRSQATGWADLSVEDHVARVRLTGGCSSGGSTFTIANLLMPTLKQWPQVTWVKIYGPAGRTQTPDGPSDSIPACLEP